MATRTGRRIAGLAAAAALGLGLAAGAAAAEPARPMIQVTAEGSAAAAPDMAVLRLGVETRGRSAAQALRENSAAVTKLMAALRAAGVAERDLQTAGLSVNPLYPSSGSYAKSSGPEIEGYQVINEVQARLRALDRMGAVLDAVVTAGANRINGLAFDIAEPEPLLARARAEAVAKARAAAEAYAAAAGLALGPVVSITDGAAAPGPMLPGAAMMRMDAASVPIARGETEVTARASVVWELVPRP